MILGIGANEHALGLSPRSRSSPGPTFAAAGALSNSVGSNVNAEDFNDSRSAGSGGPMAGGSQRPLLAREVKTLLRCGLSTVYDLYERRELIGFRVGAGRGSIRIFSSSVDDYIARQTNTPRNAETAPPSVEKVAPSTVVNQPEPKPKVKTARPAPKSRLRVVVCPPRQTGSGTPARCCGS